MAPDLGAAEAARRAEEAERRAREAEQRLHEQSLRAAEAEHKLKTDLTVIIGWSNLLMELSGDVDGFRPGLEAILRSAERMSLETERHLAQLRAEMSTEGLAPQRLDLSQILHYAVGDWSSRPENPVTFSGVEGVRVWADAGALQQVLGHLIDNAIRHSPTATRVQVSCRRTDDGTAELAVADDGPGIPEDIDIFAPFVRAGPARPDGGIGLFVVRRLVTAMGGSVSAARRPQGGSRFTVRLPGGPPPAPPARPVDVDLSDLETGYTAVPADTHDPVTGLPDRVTALNRLAQALGRARHSNPSVGVFVVEIRDRGASVAGTADGDEGGTVEASALIAAARALGQVVRPGDMVARAAPAQLLVVCEGLNGHRGLSAVRSRIEAALLEPTVVDQIQIYPIDFSVGAAMSSGGSGARPEEIVEMAAEDGRSHCHLA